MKKFPHDFEKLPTKLPLLAVQGAVLLPLLQLPIPIHELSHLEMIFEMLRTHQIIGMVQPVSTDRLIDVASPIFKTGCAGKIVDLHEVEENQYLLTLKGICRFKIIKESNHECGYRQALVSYNDYPMDYVEDSDFAFDRVRFLKVLEQYFKVVDISPNWEEIDKTSNQKLISALTIVCPLEAREKQALLEASTPQEQSRVMMTLLELAGREGGSQTCH
ncbi:LON peptidase substrate-binding domain-containing protein [Candidatus Finniella inopinata]|uniref:Lon N-terminal domain-containing protein n=1 Tax=Candidatus Finniella inopinata TaxID=1696036 RepID=A0A4Q7DJ45_9PROT|nr:LON peptidase substrate-binding domain-containing protein [Candidatus Finniella inopinata]RZI47011.1 hypothetical protein EQU50_00020 [Candidatus Finniella inopinata]